MQKQSQQNLRAISATILLMVLEDGKSLTSALAELNQKVAEKDRGLLQEVCFGVIRVLPELNFYITSLMSKTLMGKHRILHYLLMVGLYQIMYMRTPVHAAVAETVNAVNALKKISLKGLVNGVLREFLRQQDSLQHKFTQTPKLADRMLHPQWLFERIQQAYPEDWQSIVNANNQKPPMWLRVNRTQHHAHDYDQLLTEQNISAKHDANIPYAIRLLTPVNVNKLPHFAKGAVTVQDLSAQYAAYLLAPQEGETILDLCAAPGGKTTHILELAPKANILAVDIDEGRVKRINENLSRLKQQATVIVADGTTPEKWCEKNQFDRILLDAPCSATGVIRRHPDIKWLRKESDIQPLIKLQYQILTNIWPYLKQGGTLVYATCSILPEENRMQIERFLTATSDAKLQGELKQFLPDEQLGDGFFYAKLKKLS